MLPAHGPRSHPQQAVLPEKKADVWLWVPGYWKALCDALTLRDRWTLQEAVTMAGMTVTTVTSGSRMVEEEQLSYKGISRPSERRPERVPGTSTEDRRREVG